MKNFAYGTTGGPDIVNLQLGFWCDAVKTFQDVEARSRKCAVEDEDCSGGSDDYTKDEFTVDAARGVVLAGTSLSILAGQNVGPEGRGKKRRTPNLTSALKELLVPLDDRAREFIQMYDDIRHFGLAKHESIEGLTEKRYCEFMTTAQSLWKKVLAEIKIGELDLFDNMFCFEQSVECAQSTEPG